MESEALNDSLCKRLSDSPSRNHSQNIADDPTKLGSNLPVFFCVQNSCHTDLTKAEGWGWGASIKGRKERKDKQARPKTMRPLVGLCSALCIDACVAPPHLIAVARKVFLSLSPPLFPAEERKPEAFWGATTKAFTATWDWGLFAISA